MDPLDSRRITCRQELDQSLARGLGGYPTGDQLRDSMAQDARDRYEPIVAAANELYASKLAQLDGQKARAQSARAAPTVIDAIDNEIAVARASARECARAFGAALASFARHQCIDINVIELARKKPGNCWPF
jgi:hypothetical protein